MPDGFEFAESLNGVVSVRRIATPPSPIPEADVEAVRRELARHVHLRYYAVEARRKEILVCEPGGLLGERDLGEWARTFGLPVEVLSRRLAERAPTARFSPVMKFALDPGGVPRSYVAFRMCYSGEGGWLMLSAGPLDELLRRYVPLVGTEAFFELR
jgi:hypothetical protein